MQEIKNVLDGVSSLVTILGLPLLIWSLSLLVRQLRVQAYQAIYESILSIDQFMIEHSEVKPYITNGQIIPDDDPVFKEKVMGSVEMLATFFEHITAQKFWMEESKWGGWKSYMQDVYKNSPAMRDYLHNNAHWHTKELITLLQVKGKK